MGCKFPRKARLRRKEDYRGVYRCGRRLRVHPLIVRYRKRPEAPGSRLGLAIGRKNGPAVVRNMWKRAVREAFRRHRQALKEPCDMVVSVVWDAPENEARLVERAFLKAVAIINDA